MRVSGLGQCSLDSIASVETFPVEDTKNEAQDITVQGGGPVATALVSLSRLGAETFFMGRVSDDVAGTEIRRGLEKEGVDTHGVRVHPGGKSQTALIVVSRANGSRTILWKRPTVPPLGANDVDIALIKSTGMLLLDGLMREASMRAAQAARRNGVPVMLDAGTLREGMMELAALCDYIVCSESFSNSLARTPEQALERLFELNPRAATITLGSRGSITRHSGGAFRREAFKVSAVDTTGAGDVFHGGYIYGLLKGWDLEKTVEFASAFAALKCLKPGGRTGIPTLGETLRFIEGA